MEIPDKVKELLEDAGIGLDPESVITAGKEGLEAVNGIGPKTAAQLLEWAWDNAQLVETHEPEPIPPATPVSPTTPVQVRLAGRASAVLDHAVLYEGGVRVVPYAAYEQAASEYPAGTFQFRLPGDSW